MRIAVTCALSWPFIRRGNRCAWHMAEWLASRGHEVTFITPTAGTREREYHLDGVRVQALPLWDSALMTALKVQRLATFVPVCAAALGRDDYDVVQTTYPVDAAAAALHKKRTGTPYVHMLIDCLPLHNVFRFGWTLFDKGVRNASRLSSISAFVDSHLQAEKGIASEVIPLPCDVERFRFEPTPRPRARILCTASLIDPRKRVASLVEAFPRVLAQEPEAELVLSAHSTPENDAALLALVPEEVAARIRFPGVGKEEDLPALYGSATLSVLPSVNEAYGTVFFESLSCGTPAVTNASGGMPEFLTDPRVGVLADPDGGPEELARAVLAGLELGRKPETLQACRDHIALQFSWDVLGPAHERLLEDAAREAPAGRRRPRPVARDDRPEDLLTSFERSLDDAGAAHEHWFELERRRPEALAVAGWFVRAGRSLPADVSVHGEDPEAVRLLLDRLGSRATEGAGEGHDAHHSDAPTAGRVLLWGPSPEPPHLDDLRAHVDALPEGGELVVAWRGTPRARAHGRRLGDALAMAGLEPLHAQGLELSTAVQRGWGSTPLRQWLAAVPAHTLRRLVPVLARDALAVGRKRAR